MSDIVDVSRHAAVGFLLGDQVSKRRELPVAMLTAVVIGAIIGLITNWLAIAMLFRPWKAWYIGTWRVPLTPGLIPRRQQEIAVQVGEVVDQYLVTPDGLRSVLIEGHFQESLRAQLTESIDRLTTSFGSLGEWWERTTGQTKGEAASRFGRLLEETIQLVIEKAETSEKSIENFIPESMLDRLPEWSDQIAHAVMDRVRVWGDDPEFHSRIMVIIRDWVSARGFLGRIAGAFLQEEKIFKEVWNAITSFATSPEMEAALSARIYEEARIMLKNPVRDIVPVLFGSDETANLSLKYRTTIQGIQHKLIDRFWEIRMEKVKVLLTERFTHIVDWLARQVTQWLIDHAESVLRGLRIRAAVEREIASFPLPVMERLIIDVVNKELKMITFLGGLLGAIIGLGQVLLQRLWH